VEEIQLVAGGFTVPPETPRAPRSILGSTDHALERISFRPRILCVDDNESVLRMITTVLSRRFEVTSVTDGMEALEIARNAKLPFDVIISDLRMPGITGIGLLQCMKQLSPNTVRVLFTGNADFEAAIAAINASEVFRLVTKPCNPADLFTAIEAACVEHKRLIGEARGN
jgi:DNA-binding NtrC family response regulator